MKVSILQNSLRTVFCEYLHGLTQIGQEFKPKDIKLERHLPALAALTCQNQVSESNKQDQRQRITLIFFFQHSLTKQILHHWSRARTGPIPCIPVGTLHRKLERPDVDSSRDPQRIFSPDAQTPKLCYIFQERGQSLIDIPSWIQGLTQRKPPRLHYYRSFPYKWSQCFWYCFHQIFGGVHSHSAHINTAYRSRREGWEISTLSDTMSKLPPIGAVSKAEWCKNAGVKKPRV